MKRSGAPSLKKPSSGFCSPAPTNQVNRETENNRRVPFNDLNNHSQESSQNAQHDDSSDLNTSTSFRYFSCVWAKKSARKHKKWEGDALIKVGVRSVVLMDSNSGKELGRGSGYKMQDLAELEEGGRLTVGSKEVEITDKEDSQTWTRVSRNNIVEQQENCSKDDTEQRLEASATATNVRSEKSKTESFKPFKVPARVNSTLDSFVSERKVSPGVAMFDVNRPDALVFPRPPPTHPLHSPDKIVDVVLDPYVGKHLRHHQREGVLFLYRNLLGFKSPDDDDVSINGAILADDMGLGKTLQTVSIIWTFLKQSPVAGSVIAKKVLIVTPSSLLKNWENEFRKWLGSERITIHIADTADKVDQFRGYNTAPILMLSYEMLVRTVSSLTQLHWDLVVCDEAHRLKNSSIKTATSLTQLQCGRKLLLTGTPVQNDLGEFFNLVNLACPGTLGSKAMFSKQIESKIEASRQPDASIEQLEEGEEALEKLHNITNLIILRRTSEVINQFLPPKTVYIVFCRATQYQETLYKRLIDTMMEDLGNTGGQHLSSIITLKKVCNAPSLVTNVPAPGQGGPDTWEEQSGKLAVLTCLLLQLIQSTEEKIVIVSLSTSTLDLLSQLCEKYQVSTCRLDGSTPPQSRQSIVNSFNTGLTNNSPRVMLLSSKAGGTGLNLIGASRLILYDIDWNPATDMQAMARVWRDGQKRHCHVYRLVTTGTIEEKILQRQVTKRGLDSQQVVPAQFSSDELRDLFSYTGDTLDCDTHHRMNCGCGGSGEVETITSGEDDERSCQLGRNKTASDMSQDDQLTDWCHITSPLQDKIQDPLLHVAEPFVSFVMLKKFYSQCQ